MFAKAIGIYNSGLNNGDTVVQQSNDDGSDNQKFVLVNTSVRLYLVASGGTSEGAPEEYGRTDYGHAWIKIVNTSDIKINVGYYPYPLNTNESITIGRWGSVSSIGVDEFEGIWYNLENQTMMADGAFLKNKATWIDISMSQFELISSTTKNINNGYILGEDNCVDYAIHIWNLVSYSTIDASDMSHLGISSPKKLEDKIAESFTYVSDISPVYTYYYGYYTNNQFQTKSY